MRKSSSRAMAGRQRSSWQPRRMKPYERPWLSSPIQRRSLRFSAPRHILLRVTRGLPRMRCSMKEPSGQAFARTCDRVEIPPEVADTARNLPPDVKRQIKQALMHLEEVPEARKPLNG